MNTLEPLKALVAQLEAEEAKPQPTTPKPRCDAQGRLLSAPDDGARVYSIESTGYSSNFWDEMLPSKYTELEYGHLFISQPAAEAELTRLKCLQRLRGMEGFTPYGGFELPMESSIILDGFQTLKQRVAAEATITPEERAAFLYREPNHA
jgi:hypothetical protein